MKTIFYLKHIVIYICILFSVQQALAQVDSTYIGFFDRTFSAHLYTSNKFMFLSNEHGEADSPIVYSSNNPFSAGIGATYKNISLSASLGFDFTRDKGRGKTKTVDFQYHYYGRKYIFDFFFQDYKGFFSDNAKGGGYTVYPEMNVIQYGAFSQYVFNGDRFSYKAAFSQNERQLRSTGSVLLGGGAYYNKARSDSPIYSDKNKLANIQLGVSGGYAYTWVANKRFFLSASLSFGVNWGLESFDRIGKDKLQIYPTFYPRVSLGYNHDTWSARLSALNNRVYVLHTDASRITFDTGSIQLIFIKRFSSEPKFLKNTATFIENLNPF